MKKFGYFKLKNPSTTLRVTATQAFNVPVRLKFHATVRLSGVEVCN